MKTILNTTFALTAAAVLAISAAPAFASFSFGACNVPGDGGYEAVLIVNLPDGQRVLRKGDRGLNHTYMFSPRLAEAWIRAAFPTQTDGQEGQSGAMCGSVRDIDSTNTAEVSFPTTPRTEIEFEYDECGTACR